MSVPITKATLIAAYELLRTVPPFLGWKLPDVGEVEFGVFRAKTHFGDCDGDRIRVSCGKHGQLNTLLATVAHECIHLHQMGNDLETRGVEHNADFKRRAARICRQHGWDAATF
jgi:hypothetical protein